MVIIERLTVLGVSVMGLALGYVYTARFLGPGVLTVLLGLVMGGVLAELLQRGLVKERRRA